MNDWLTIVQTLEDAGATRDPYIRKCCRLCLQGYPDKLNELLTQKPHLYRNALINLKTRERHPFEPAPRPDELRLIDGSHKLGIVNDQGHMMGLDPLDFTRGLFVCGETGSGKTYPLLRLYRDILQTPPEERGFNLLIIQLVKRDADFLLKHAPHLRIIEWQDLRYNMFEVEPWDTRASHNDKAASIFANVNYLMAMTHPLFARALHMAALSTQPYDRPPTFEDISRMIDPCAAELGLEGYEKKNATDRLKIRLSEFIQTGNILNTSHGFPMNDVWAHEDICLNVMDQTNPYVSATILTHLLSQLQRYHDSNYDGTSRLKTLVSIDECRTLFAKKEGLRDHNPDIFLEQWVTTARASSIGRITATQEPHSVSPYLLDNSAFFMTFPIGGTSLETVKRFQNLTNDQTGYIDKLPPYGTAVMRDRRFDRPYLVSVPDDLQPEHITREETERIMRPYLETLHDRYAPPTQNPEQEESPQQTRQSDERTHAPPTIDYINARIRETRYESLTMQNAMLILEKLKEAPFTHFTALRDTLDLGTQTDYAVEWLGKNGYVETAKLKTAPNKTAKFLMLTRHAQDQLNIPESQRVSTTQFKHSYYKHRVHEWLTAQGHHAVMEYHTLPNGSPSPYNERIDVASITENETIAYEVVLTVERRALLQTIMKCFGLFQVSRCYIICDRKDPELEKARHIVDTAPDDELPSQIRELLSFTTISTFLRKPKRKNV